MEELLLPYGLPALFLLSFLAATVLPLGSEWFLVVLILQNSDPVAAVAVSSFGNFLGACTTYGLGRWGADFFQEKILRMDQKSIDRGEKLFSRYGVWSLLFSWLPIVGDPLCFIAGVLKSPLLLSAILVIVGKTARYTFIALVTGVSQI